MPIAANARLAPDSFAELVAELTPAVVSVASTRGPVTANTPSRGEMPQFPPGSPFEKFFNRPGGVPGTGPVPERRALGSGFIIDQDGYVITNNHVIDGAKSIDVTLHDERSFNAILVGTDPDTDLALLKIDAEEALPYVKFGDSDTAKVGNWVLAIGNPFGLGNTVTAGIISARSRIINAGPYDDFIQTDAPINRGNSGGPLFDINGTVIGVNTAIFSPNGGNVGIGFAVPANMVALVADQLRANGQVSRGWLGVQIQNVTPDIAESLDLVDASGALVSDVVEGSPADLAGILAGDVIHDFAGQTVNDARTLSRLVAHFKIGQSALISLFRQGREVEIDLEISERKNVVAEASISGPLGMALTELSDELRHRYQIGEDTTGVVVQRVLPDSFAGNAGIRVGDVLLSVNRTPVSRPSDVAVQVEVARKEKRKTILLLIDRQGQRLFTAAPLNVA